MTTSQDRERPADRPPTTRLQPLSRRECERLLEEHGVGRLAWAGPDGVRLLPVTYLWTGEVLLFRTAPDGGLAALVEPTEVVFEVDTLDLRRRSGASVLVRGRSGPAAPDAVAASGVPVPWAGGERTLLVAVTAEQVTGRVVVRDPGYRER